MEKVKSYCISLFEMSRVEEAAIEFLCYHVLGLSNILFTAGFESDVVNEIGTFTTEFLFVGVFSCLWLICPHTSRVGGIGI